MDIQDALNVVDEEIAVAERNLQIARDARTALIKLEFTNTN
jgi:hypothetical protein